jgi:hypothetical protein
MRHYWRWVGVLGVVLLGLSTPACVNTGSPDNLVHGSGRVIREDRPVQGLNEVVLQMSGDLDIEQTNYEGLTIEAEDNIVPLIETTVQAGRLQIRTVPGSAGFTTNKGVKFHLRVHDLRYIGNEASGTIQMAQLSTTSLTAAASGSGGIRLKSLAAASCTARLSGSGNIYLDGTVVRQDVACSGSGAYDGRDLQSRQATVTLSGSGDATLRAQERLDVSISGSGSVGYIGNPVMNVNTSGSGRVRQIGR